MQFSKIILFLFLFASTSGQGQTLASKLPIIIINTPNGFEIPDEPKVDATMKIINNGPGMLNHVTDPANDFDGHIGIERRGSTSQFYDKKPYSLEVRDSLGDDKSASLLGMPKESDWALIAPLNDKSLMRDVLAHKLASQVLPWAPRTRYVEVVINNQYQGIYVLIEKIKRGKNRVNIAKLNPDDLAGDSLTGGYILSMDKLNQAPGGDWASPYPPFAGSGATTWFQVVYPKPVDIQAAQRNYIRQYITDFEDALNAWQPNSPGTPAYEQWIDVDTWINYMLVDEVAKNVDGYRLSSYFTKDRDDRDPHLQMGPLWDFNIAFGIGDYCEGASTSGWAKDFNQVCPDDGWVIHFWWAKLFEDTLFQDRVRSRWQELRSSIWSDDKMLGCVDSLAGELADGQARNFQRWPVLGTYVWPNSFVGQTYQQEVGFLRTWLQERLHWMDDNMDELVYIAPPPPYPYLERAELYPNPLLNNQLLNLKYSTAGIDGATFSLFNEQGTLVLSPTRLPKGERVIHQINLTGLPQGTYFYMIELFGKKLKKGKLEVIR